MKRLDYSPAARADLRDIAAYIAEDNPDRALGFVAELEAKAGQAADRPRSFGKRDDVQAGLRAAAHGRYLLFFREIEDGIRIIRVLHSARDLARAFNPPDA